MSEFDIEPVRGLPAPLPEGETLLWQGHPEWRALALRAFHVGHVALYFGLLAVWAVATAWSNGAGWATSLASAGWVPVMAAAALVLIGLLAWLSARTTVYTITSRRIVLRIGIALPIIINVPFRAVEAVGMRRHRDGTGDLPATLSKGYRLAFLVLWPHARPWFVRSPQPMLRCIAEPERVGRLLAEAISAAAPRVVPRDEAAVPARGRLPVPASLPAVAA
ncbi:MAG: photosynthetic complex putative assembly protein PuhB [Reyranellaceae bacterium]